MQKLIALLVVSALSVSAQAAPNAGDQCDKKSSGDHAVGKNGEVLVCVTNDVKWKVVEPKAGDSCFTLKQDQAATGAGGQKLICHDGKWVTRSTAAH